jgi:hypothetical protein
MNMAQTGKAPADKASTPFSTRDGTPTGQGTGASGAHNFLTDPKGTSTGAGGRDFTKENHASGSLGSAYDANPAETPKDMGGIHLKADPGPVSKTANANGTTSSNAGYKGAPSGRSAPFKNLK